MIAMPSVADRPNYHRWFLDLRNGDLFRYERSANCYI